MITIIFIILKQKITNKQRAISLKEDACQMRKRKQHKLIALKI